MLRLKDLREDADLRQIDVAKAINCSQTCYSNYELELRDIPTKTLKDLAKFFNTSTDYILGVTNIKEPYPANDSKDLNKKSVPVDWKNSGISADKQAL